MKVLGITAEYNPFHRGHAYQIAQARRESDCDLVVAAMSGDFVQRGGPAILEKRLRVQQALRNGVDCVLELPVCVSTSSAEAFAYGAVSLLTAFGCNLLSYGCETQDHDELLKIAKVLCEEPEVYKETLKRTLSQGKSFPAAREAALRQILPDISPVTLSGANNILAIEYEKALIRLKEDSNFINENKNVISYPILRLGSDYTDESLEQNSYASATAIRKAMLEGNENWRNYVPESDMLLQDQNIHAFLPVTAEDFSTLLGRELFLATKEELVRCEDIGEDLAARILKHRNEFHGFEDYVRVIKNKAYTESRIRRCLTRMMLKLTDTDGKTFKPQYLRILGMKKEKSPEIGKLISKCNIPVITRAADAQKLFPAGIPKAFQQDIDASNLYKMVQTCKYHTAFRHEYEEFFMVI